jgi:hypothetical protein
LIARISRILARRPHNAVTKGAQMSKPFSPIPVGAVDLSRRVVLARVTRMRESAAASAGLRHPFLNFPQQRMQKTCDFYLALRP